MVSPYTQNINTQLSTNNFINILYFCIHVKYLFKTQHYIYIFIHLWIKLFLCSMLALETKQSRAKWLVPLTQYCAGEKWSRMRWAGHVARMGEERGVYRVLLGKPEGRRPLGRPRHRWVDNIRMDLQEVGCGYMAWIGLAQDRDRWQTLVSAVMNLRVPWNAGNFLTSCKPVSFSRRTLHHGVSK